LAGTAEKGICVPGGGLAWMNVVSWKTCLGTLQALYWGFVWELVVASGRLFTKPCEHIYIYIYVCVCVCVCAFELCREGELTHMNLVFGDKNCKIRDLDKLLLKKYRAAILFLSNQGVTLCWAVKGRTVNGETFPVTFELGRRHINFNLIVLTAGIFGHFEA
jgi:hypothetical protein